MTQDLSKLSIREYADLLGSDAPSPGGGSAAAFTGAFGGALVEMVCGINLKRTKNPDPDKSADNLKKATPLRKALVELATRDAAAYAGIVSHWKTKGPDLEKALEAACDVPLEIAALSLELLKIGKSETARTAVGLLGDLTESVMLLDTAIRSSRLHVEVNAQMMQEAGEASKRRSRMMAILDEASQIATGFEGTRQKGG